MRLSLVVAGQLGSQINDWEGVLDLRNERLVKL